jgi:hypothetical protein
MQDPLIDAAQRLGVPTHASAGPEPGELSGQLWATWPRDRLEIAHEALARVVRYDRDARVERCGKGNVWRASARGWSYEGNFVDAVATLALRVSETRPTENSRCAGREGHCRS